MNPTVQFLSEVRDGLEHVDYNLIYSPTFNADPIYTEIADLKDEFVPTSFFLRKGKKKRYSRRR